MDLEQKGRQLALSFVNLDDIVLARELSGSGMNLLALVGRSLVGTAVTGGGLATRAAVFGAQIATKSAVAATAAAKGVVPGAEAAEQMAYDLDQRVGASAEAASFVASRGVEVGKMDGRPPTDPLFGNEWLGKRLEPGASWNTVLADSAVNLSRLAALPLMLTAATMERAMSSPTGQQVTRLVWDSLSSLLDSPARASNATETADRADKRAMLAAIGMTPLWLATQDLVDLGEGLTRAALGDLRKLREVLTTIVDRLEASDDDAGRHAPRQLLSALDEHEASDPAGLVAIGAALFEDSANLAKLFSIYSGLLTRLSVGPMQSMMNGGVDEIEAWVRADEASRAATGAGTTERCPAAVERLETLVAEWTTPGDRASGRRFYAASTIDLARDTVFSYSSRAVGREAALARIERLFGAHARARIEDDCSLRDDILTAGSDRDRRIAALVSALQRDGRPRLMAARDRAAARLASLTANENLIERFVPQRIGDRAAVLRRFVGMADVANALDGVPSEEPSRRQVLARFDAWMAADEAQPH